MEGAQARHAERAFQQAQQHGPRGGEVGRRAHVGKAGTAAADEVAGVECGALGVKPRGDAQRAPQFHQMGVSLDAVGRESLQGQRGIGQQGCQGIPRCRGAPVGLDQVVVARVTLADGDAPAIDVHLAAHAVHHGGSHVDIGHRHDVPGEIDGAAANHGQNHHHCRHEL